MIPGSPGLPLPDLDEAATDTREPVDLPAIWTAFFAANTASAQFSWAREHGRTLVAYARRLELKDETPF
jgi:hypothetical protein